jgi:Family of unknown function (DUF6502)
VNQKNTSTESPLPGVEEAMRVLEPLAGVLLMLNVPYAQAEEWLRAAYVHSCARAYAAQGKAATVSALSVATGLRRREVKRLLETPVASAPLAITKLPAAVRLRWLTDPRFLDKHGEPLALPRVAPPGEVSFAELSMSASKDVHPRSMLDELLRVGSVEIDDSDRVVLRRRHASAQTARDAKWAVGSTNLGDHLSAVLINLLSEPPPMFERAVFADGLTLRSAQRATELARELWEPALPRMREKLQALVNLDADSIKAQQMGWRVRIGLYSYFAPAEESALPVEVKTYRPRKQPAGPKKKESSP